MALCLLGCAALASFALPGLPDRVAALLRRLAFWQITTDPAVCVFERGCARQLAAAFADPEVRTRLNNIE